MGDEQGMIAQSIITDDKENLVSTVDPITKRQGIYNDLIGAYKSHFETKSKHNRILKIIFFVIIMALIAILIVGMIILSVFIVCKWGESPQAVTVIITSIATVLSTIIALPTIICNYLFHKKEDKDLLDFIVKLDKNQ